MAADKTDTQAAIKHFEDSLSVLMHAVRMVAKDIRRLVEIVEAHDA